MIIRFYFNSLVIREGSKGNRRFPFKGEGVDRVGH